MNFRQEMRLSGNYFERAVYYIIPWTLLATVIIHFATKQTLVQSLLVFGILTTAFWVLDTLIIIFKFKTPKNLRSNHKMYWGARAISPDEIIKITPVNDKRFRWNFRMVEFILNDGTYFMVIDKPKNVVSDIQNKPSKTIRLILKLYPELHNKIEAPKQI